MVLLETAFINFGLMAVSDILSEVCSLERAEVSVVSNSMNSSSTGEHRVIHETELRFRCSPSVALLKTHSGEIQAVTFATLPLESSLRAFSEQSSSRRAIDDQLPGEET